MWLASVAFSSAPTTPPACLSAPEFFLGEVGDMRVKKPDSPRFLDRVDGLKLPRVSLRFHAAYRETARKIVPGIFRVFRFFANSNARNAMPPLDLRIRLDRTGPMGRVLPVVVGYIDDTGRPWRLRYETWAEGERAVRALRIGSSRPFARVLVQEPVAVGRASEVGPEVARP
jgi:hypothetical protein